jgi:hypothetical protein
LLKRAHAARRSNRETELTGCEPSRQYSLALPLVGGARPL